MELQYPLHGCGQGSLHQMMGQWISKTLHIPGDTLPVCTPRSTGSGDLCNNATNDTRERWGYAGVQCLDFVWSDWCFCTINCFLQELFVHLRVLVVGLVQRDVEG